jgi:hypothetical protein
MIPQAENKGHVPMVSVKAETTGDTRCALGGSGGGPASIGSAELRALRKQVEAGTWNVTAEDRESVLALCRTYVASDMADERARIRASELLAACDRDNLNRLVALDKMARLDDGSATERSEGVMINIVRYETPTGETIEAPQ